MLGLDWKQVAGIVAVGGSIISGMLYILKRFLDAWGEFKEWRLQQQGMTAQVVKLMKWKDNMDARVGMNHLTCSESKILAKAARDDVAELTKRFNRRVNGKV